MSFLKEACARCNNHRICVLVEKLQQFAPLDEAMIGCRYYVPAAEEEGSHTPWPSASRRDMDTENLKSISDAIHAATGDQSETLNIRAGSHCDICGADGVETIACEECGREACLSECVTETLDGHIYCNECFDKMEAPSELRLR